MAFAPGHLNYDDLKRLSKDNLATGITLKPLEKIEGVCVGCAMGSRKKSVSKEN